MKRRSFMKALAVLGGGLTVGSELPGWLADAASVPATALGEPDLPPGARHLFTVLHTNDVHSRIDPFPEGSGRFAGLAGAARRASLIGAIRERHRDVLLLDAGDAFQGTPYFNLFHGEVEFKVMSALGYDAMTIGNHDFDAGIDGLLRAAEFASFELVSSNYDFSSTPLRHVVRPYLTRSLGGVKVGVFGLGVILEGLVQESLCKGVVYNDPVATARRMVALLRGDERCDVVICLSHLGNDGTRGEPGEQQVAREVSGMDLVIGGHSHTFMERPVEVVHGDRRTLVFQVGWAGIYLGRVDFYRNPDGRLGARASALKIGNPLRHAASLV